jgi:hypothetical protein
MITKRRRERSIPLCFARERGEEEKRMGRREK